MNVLDLLGSDTSPSATLAFLELVCVSDCKVWNVLVVEYTVERSLFKGSSLHFLPFSPLLPSNMGGRGATKYQTSTCV